MRFPKPLLLALLLAGCHDKPPPPAVVSPRPPQLISEDVLARPPAVNTALVKQILIGWAELSGAYGRNPMDKRAAARTHAQAEALTRSIYGRARSGESFDKLMAEFSEDGYSAPQGIAYQVKPDGTFEPAFQSLALRLQVNEVGVTRTAYGFNIMQRVR